MKKLLRSLFPALFFLLLISLQSAVGCSSAQEIQHHAPSIQVNACHFLIDISTTDACCDNAACHRNSSPLRNFGSPEYVNYIKDLLPLILESRQQLPQSKTVAAFIQPTIGLQSIRQEPVTPIAPRHALAFLRSTVLLH